MAMAVYVHRYQRITPSGNLRQMSAGYPAGKNIIEERGDTFCPAILVAGNNSATIAAVEHAAAIWRRPEERRFRIWLKSAPEKHPRLPRAASLWW
jgi:hypothetical protein